MNEEPIPPEEITRYRKSKKLSQARFGELCGVSKGAVCNWEKGRVTPSGSSLKTLKRIINGDDAIVFVTDLEVKLLDANVEAGGFKNRETYLTESLKYLIYKKSFELGLDVPKEKVSSMVAEEETHYQANVIDPSEKVNVSGGETRVEGA